MYSVLLRKSFLFANIVSFLESIEQMEAVGSVNQAPLLILLL